MKSLPLHTRMWNWLKGNDKMINKFLKNFLTTVFLNLVSASHLTPKITSRRQTHQQKVYFESYATPKMSNSPITSKGHRRRQLARKEIDTGLSPRKQNLHTAFRWVTPVSPEGDFSLILSSIFGPTVHENDYEPLTIVFFQLLYFLKGNIFMVVIFFPILHHIGWVGGT